MSRNTEDNQENQDNKENQDDQENQDNKENQDDQENQDSKEEQDDQENQDNKENYNYQENQDDQTDQDNLEDQDNSERKLTIESTVTVSAIGLALSDPTTAEKLDRVEGLISQKKLPQIPLPQDNIQEQHTDEQKSSIPSDAYDDAPTGKTAEKSTARGDNIHSVGAQLGIVNAEETKSKSQVLLHNKSHTEALSRITQSHQYSLKYGSKTDEGDTLTSHSKSSGKLPSADEDALLYIKMSELSFCISDTDLQELRSKPRIKNISTSTKPDYMSPAEFEIVANKLYKCCLKSTTDMHELHLRRVLALPIIKDIILRADPVYIKVPHVIHMIWSIMSCLHHFQLRLKSGSHKIVMHTRLKMLQKCMDYYLLLIRMFKPKVHRIILSAIVTFYKDGKLWEIDFSVTELIVALLKVYTDIEDGVNDLLDYAVDAAEVNITEAQSLMQVIYEVLKKVQWRSISKNLMDRLIVMLECSLAPDNEDETLYVPLKLGIELSIRHVINNMSNNDLMIMLKRILRVMVNEYGIDEITAVFGSLAIYCAKKFVMKTFYSNITPDLLVSISKLTHAKDPLSFILAIRIWLNLIDRSGNSAKLSKPKIFFSGSEYHINIKDKCNHKDKKFFKAYRNYFYDLSVDCFKDCETSTEINAVFEMCALTLVEIPCGHTAAIFTAVAMSIQEYALKRTSESLLMSHYLHATALSIMSLICFIHKAEVFYSYVNLIIDRRAEWAPQLIPPLKVKYEYALHHVLWNKPDLFFEDWETRYGLWKCFRIRKKKKSEKIQE